MVAGPFDIRTVIWRHNVGRKCDEIRRIIKVSDKIRDVTRMKVIKLQVYELLCIDR
jgi:hypothetical protein